jgi:hypothetical protein
LFNLVRALPDTLRYENHLILAEGDYVIAHGRFSGHGRPAPRVAADVVRFEDGKLAEHWGRPSGRGDQSAIPQRAADVRRSLPGLSLHRNRAPKDEQVELTLSTTMQFTLGSLDHIASVRGTNPAAGSSAFHWFC